MNKIITTTFICKNPQKAFIYLENDKKINIKRKDFNNAFDGDEVLVELLDNDSAKVIEIIKRNSNKFLGTVILKKKNKAIIKIQKSDFIVVSTNSISSLSKNDLISFEINYSTLDKKDILIKNIKNFGKFDSSNNILNSLIDSYGVEQGFKNEIKNEAMKIKLPNIDLEREKRVDLTDKYFITIDDISAKDLDDAIYLERVDDKFVLYVSIADVSHFVTEDSILDLEARKRGNSIYLVNRVIPMLPKKLSNNLCSLNPNEEKLCFTVKITYDKNLMIKDIDFFKSIISSKRRMSYDEVNEIFEKKINTLPMLNDMLELSLLIRNKKLKKGMISFNIPEIKLILNEKENIKEIKLRKNSLAENLIEDFMVEANSAVAQCLFFQEIPTIYRIHEKPEIDAIKNLSMNLKELGHSLTVVNDIHPGKLSKLINDTYNDENHYIIHKYILKSLKKAMYSNENLGHFALAIPNYLHFTSPIRRYSDLVAHRSLNIFLNKYNNKDFKKLEQKYKIIAKNISKTERIAETLEKYSVKLKLMDYLKNKKGQIFNTKISGFLSNKVFLETDSFIEVVFYPNKSKDYQILSKKNTYYLFNKNNNKEYHLGDNLEMIITDFDYNKIEIIAEVLK